MSKFCGKCDFYDGFVAIGSDGDEKKIEQNLKKLKLYIRGKDGRDHLVKSDTVKDIAKYYPYLEAIAYGNQDGTRIIHLSGNSFIDQEERERVNWYVDEGMKYWRKCKRNKIPFNVDEFVDQTKWWGSEDLRRIIGEKIAKDGKNAEFDDIHLPMHEYYRQRWFEEMVRVGYTEREAYNWCFKGFFDDEKTIEKRLGRPLK